MSNFLRKSTLFGQKFENPPLIGSKIRQGTKPMSIIKQCATFLLKRDYKATRLGHSKRQCHLNEKPRVQIQKFFFHVSFQKCKTLPQPSPNLGRDRRKVFG